MTISRESLGSLIPINKGSFGEVFRAEAFRLDGDETPLAYKEFSANLEDQANAAGAAVAFRARLTSDERTELDAISTWPTALVQEGGQVRGLLMPLLPDDFFCRLIDPDTLKHAS